MTKFFLTLISLLLPVIVIAEDELLSLDEQAKKLSPILHECITSQVSTSTPNEFNKIVQKCDEYVLAASPQLQAGLDGADGWMALRGAYWTLANLWDIQLNHFYTQKVESCRAADLKKLTLLRKRQREWIVSRDAQMNAIDPEEGSGQQIHESETKHQLTARRTLEFARTAESCDQVE